jgi:hypothetical protein
MHLADRPGVSRIKGVGLNMPTLALAFLFSAEGSFLGFAKVNQRLVQ